MNTLLITRSARFEDRFIVISMQSGAQLRFPISENPRLGNGSPPQLSNIGISPFGLHWPDLDEDLSIRGTARGEYGQSARPL